MKKIRVGVIGSLGRMGKEITAVLQSRSDCILSAAIVRNGSDESYQCSYGKFESNLSKNVDVLIDFSSVENFNKALDFAKKHKIPLVSGTTGITDAQKKKLKEASKYTAVLWAPNMSLGISILHKAIESLSLAKDFDFQVEEFHHNKKKDNPGGTALALQETLNSVTGKKNPTPIGIRGGGIYGVHKVYAMAQEEVLCFEHQVLSRNVFAKGAVHAAVWLAKKRPGLYSMRDLVV